FAAAGDSEAVDVGLDLIQMWEHTEPKSLDQQLAPLALELASRPVHDTGRRDISRWVEVLLLLGPMYPRRVAQLIVERMTDQRARPGISDEQYVEVVTRAAAADPAVVMEAIGTAILDSEKRLIFGIAVYEGLFDAIGVNAVQEWLARHGLENLQWLARH